MLGIPEPILRNALESGIWTGALNLLDCNYLITPNPIWPMKSVVYGFTVTLLGNLAEDYFKNTLSAYVTALLGGFVLTSMMSSSSRRRSDFLCLEFTRLSVNGVLPVVAFFKVARAFIPVQHSKKTEEPEEITEPLPLDLRSYIGSAPERTPN